VAIINASCRNNLWEASGGKNEEKEEKEKVGNMEGHAHFEISMARRIEGWTCNR
jgi:hypothetical protein